MRNKQLALLKKKVFVGKKRGESERAHDLYVMNVIISRIAIKKTEHDIKTLSKLSAQFRDKNKNSKAQTRTHILPTFFPTLLVFRESRS